MKLVIIRHPETNASAGLAGEPDNPSPQGRVQLSGATETCKSENIQAIVYSTQPRAVIAAGILAKALDIPSIAQDGLEERNFGDWNSWEWPQISAELDKLTTEERYTFVPPNGESWQQMEERLRAALSNIAALDYDSVAIMTHWGPIRCLLPMIKDEPKESTVDLNVENGQTFVLDYA